MPLNSLPTNIGTDNSTLFLGLAEWAYDVTAGFFWTASLIAFSVVMYIATSRLDTNRQYGFASFIGLTGAIMLATLRLMPWWIATIFILNGCIALAVMLLSER